MQPLSYIIHLCPPPLVSVDATRHLPAVYVLSAIQNLFPYTNSAAHSHPICEVWYQLSFASVPLAIRTTRMATQLWFQCNSRRGTMAAVAVDIPSVIWLDDTFINIMLCRQLYSWAPLALKLQGEHKHWGRPRYHSQHIKVNASKLHKKKTLGHVLNLHLRAKACRWFTYQTMVVYHSCVVWVRSQLS